MSILLVLAYWSWPTDFGRLVIVIVFAGMGFIPGMVLGVVFPVLIAPTEILQSFTLSLQLLSIGRQMSNKRKEYGLSRAFSRLQAGFVHTFLCSPKEKYAKERAPRCLAFGFPRRLVQHAGKFLPGFRVSKYLHALYLQNGDIGILQH
ncbi:MAG: hypothetical protein SWH68_00820 [Thermodesulfobacteriota bacterium]|nr:hypothetical protein [Thermodesulfobacteriota bacterium]